MTLYVNMIGGPGSGKSTAAAGVFSKLKIQEVDCEMVLEFAKDLVWDERYKEFGNQAFIFGNQCQRLRRLEGRVAVAVTDSALLLTLVYNEGDKLLNQVALNEFNRYDNLNYFLVRQKIYNPNGRLQTEEKARLLDAEVEQMLESNSIAYTKLASSEESMIQITQDVMKRLGGK